MCLKSVKQKRKMYYYINEGISLFYGRSSSKSMLVHEVKLKRREGKEMHGGENEPPPPPGGQEEGPEGQRPEAKGLCAGCQGAVVESV